MIKWFKGLDTGWKILVIILIIGLVCSIPYVLSGEYDKDREAEKQQTVDSSQQNKQKYSDDEIEQAYRKCVVQEVRDIYKTPAIDQEEERANAITKAKQFCDLYKTEYKDGLNAIVEDTKIDWENSGEKNDELLGHTLQWWYENYENIDKLYDDALKQ